MHTEDDVREMCLCSVDSRRNQHVEMETEALMDVFHDRN